MGAGIIQEIKISACLKMNVEVIMVIDRDRLVVMNQHYKNYSLDYFLDCQEKFGIKNIELWMSMQHFSLDSVRYGDCRTLLKKLSARGQQVVCVTAPSCDYQYQYACQDDLLRKKCIGYFKNGLNVAEELEAKFMTCNSGWGYGNSKIEDSMNAFRSTLDELVPIAERKGITIVIETLTADESNLVTNVYSLKEIIDEYSSPSLKAMADTVAMADAGESMEEWFEILGADIRYMHFVDGKKSWEHLAWGDGIYDLGRMFRTIEACGYEGYLSQELIAEDYLSDPEKADEVNFCTLKKYFTFI